MRNSVRAMLRCFAALTTAVSFSVAAQAPITLNGASQFNDDHAFTKAMVRFEELVKKYYGKPVNFVLHKNSALGLEKQYFEYMAQGKAVDYAIVSPAHMSTFSKAAPFVDAPFLFRDLATLRTDIPVFGDVEELRWGGPTAAFAPLAEKMDRARPGDTPTAKRR